MVYKYSYRQGARSYPVDAQRAGEFINDLSEKENGVTAQSVLDASRDEDALLHPCFEWDDAIGAEKYRLEQSKLLIGDIVRVVVRNENETKQARAFISVTPSQTRKPNTYQPMAQVMSVDETREIVLKNALMELKWFRRKYEELTELASLFVEIDKLIVNE